ncbi:caspase family protein [Streptomyces chartreusis]|uniref:caspase family protein n=1 Tax=Streptomyces chartreusis TaxID=1969 RepID=UPI0033FAD3B1
MSAPRAGGAGGGGPRRFLIATAVAHYPKHPKWDRPALVDARERIIDLFTRELGYRHQTALGLDPTRAQMTDQLRAFCKSPDRREDDLLAVYISGHGEVLEDDRDHVLYTSDTDPEDIAYTALPTVELARAMLRDTKLRRLLLLLDTCYSSQGGNEMAAAALERINRQWRLATGSGLVIVSSAQPHQQAKAGLFPQLLNDAIGSWATAGHGPQELSVSSVVQQMNDHPARPGYQHIGLALVGLAGEPPAFLANPRHSTRLTDVDLAIQQAAEFDEQARRRDTELTTRLLVRAMGYHGDASQGWWFCGRHKVLADLTRWLRNPGTDTRAAWRVVTAGPGSGKTAVLGLIAALAHPERRRTVPVDALNLAPGLLPDEDAVDVAIYAQNLTDSDLMQGLAAAARVRADTVGELLEAVETRGENRQHQRPFTALIDALDEAATPDSLCSRILRPLIDHSRGRIRLLLGTRPHLLDRLGIAPHTAADRDEVIDLDSPRYADREALRAYTVRNLLEARRTSPYRHAPEALRPVARAVAAAAGTSFLVARITAGTLAAADHVVAEPHDRAWRKSLPRLPGQAMRDDLTRRLGTDAQRAMDLLRPLAFAEGQGLPWEDIWAPLASEISGRTYTDDDLLWLRRRAGSYVVEATENGRSAYRLYHHALAEHLREATDPPAVHAAFTEVLTDRVPYRGDATRYWSRAHPYTLNYLATHATTARRLDEILNDTEYLVHAAPRGLTPHLHHAHTEQGRLAAAIYRTSLSLHATAPTALRRQVLALDAARAGATSQHQQLTRQIPQGDWIPQWATGSDFSPALRDTLTNHNGTLPQVACAELNGTPVAVTGGFDKTVRVWDLASGTQLGHPLTGHTDGVNGVASTMLNGIPVAVSASSDGTVRVWNLTSGTQINQPLTGHTSAVTAIACTTLNNTPVAVTGSRDTTVQVWDLASGTQIGQPLAGHTSAVNGVACTELDDTPVAVTGSGDGTVRVWDLTSGTQIGQPLTGHTDGVHTVACTTLNGTPLAVTGGFDTTVRVWDLTSGTQIGQPLAGHTSAVNGVACTELDDTPVAVTGSGDGTVRVWDLTSGTQIGQPLAGHTSAVTAAACTTLNNTPVAVTASMDDTVRLWDLASGMVGWPLAGHTSAVNGVACTELDDTPVAVTGSGDGTVRVWDLTSGTQIGRPLTSGTSAVHAVACTELDDTPVAVTGSGDGTVRVWDLTSGTQIGQPLTGHTSAVHAVACTTLNNTPVAVTGSWDTTVRVWDLTSGTQIGRPLTSGTTGVHAVACITLNGTPVAVTGSEGRTVEVWDLGSGTQIGRPLTGHTGSVQAVACTTLNGTPVAVTGSLAGEVWVWDLTSGTQIGRPLTGHTHWVSAIACTVLNETPVAVTSIGDGTVRLWNLRTGEPAGLLAAAGPSAVALTLEGDLVLGMGRDVAVFSRRPPRKPY